MANARAFNAPPGDGWRIEVNLKLGKWRWVQRYGKKRRVTPYRPISELPEDRLEQALARSKNARKANAQSDR